ncbi:unnamed protein product, partial [Allacma fusca]
MWFITQRNFRGKKESKSAALESSVEIALENLSVGKLVFTEILLSPSNMIAHRIVNQAMLKFPTTDFCLVKNSNEPANEENIAAATSKVVKMENIETVQHSLLYIDDSALFQKVIKLVRPGGFILYKSSSVKPLFSTEVLLVSKKSFQQDSKNYTYYLLRNLQQLPQLTSRIINTDAERYSWIDTAKEALEALADTDRIYFFSQLPKSDVPILGMNSMKTTNGTLFVVHPIDGTVDMLKDLVSQLCLTVYGIECANEAPLESLEKLAGYYLNKIREVQPLGPYKFCGYSFGANVAFEMALQLERRGETVSLLLMLDGSPRWKHYNDNYSSYTGGVVEVVDLVFVAYLSQYLPTFSSLMYQELKGRNTEEDKIHHVAVTLNDAYPHVGLKTITESVCALKARLTSRDDGTSLGSNLGRESNTVKINMISYHGYGSSGGNISCFDCEIKLFEPRAFKYLDTIQGQVIINTQTKVHFKSLRVQLEGETRCRFQSKIENGLTHHLKTDSFFPSEDHKTLDPDRMCVYIIGRKDKSSPEETKSFPRGEHIFPFQLEIVGTSFPSTYQTSFGSIDYRLSVHAVSRRDDIGWSDVSPNSIRVRIKGHLNLSSDPSLSKPFTLTKKKKSKSVFTKQPISKFSVTTLSGLTVKDEAGIVIGTCDKEGGSSSTTLVRNKDSDDEWDCNSNQQASVLPPSYSSVASRKPVLEALPPPPSYNKAVGIDDWEEFNPFRPR